MTTDEDIAVTAVSRMTVADAADLLREYDRTLDRADVEGDHRERVRETITNLDAALE